MSHVFFDKLDARTQAARTSPLAAALRRKDAEIETLRERVRQLERALAPEIAVPLGWPHLTRQEHALVAALAGRAVAPIAMLTLVLEANGHGHDLAAAVETLRVRISLLRKKLRPHGVEIANERGIGYSLDAATRARLRAKPEAR